MSALPHRAGVVALLGRPNAGKSTLLNALLGEKLAIVTRKPQTTRSRILGILTRDEAQLLLLDTPGFHASERAFNRALNEQVDAVATDCDVALLLVDPAAGWDEAHEALRARLLKRGATVLVVATQRDRRPELPADLPADLAVSAKTGEGLEELLTRTIAGLPESPPLYGPEELTNRSMRFLSAELIREAVFEELSEELPYSTAVEIGTFDESRPGLTTLRATLLVERNSQQGMVVGKGGTMIKRIGTRARRELEALIGTKVFLDLRVKVEPRWAKKPGRLKALGYD